LKDYITEYYKRLFGPHVQNSFSIDETLGHDINQVLEEENEVMMAPFSEEVKFIVFDMEHNKGPGLDDFPAEFYQFIWEIVKPDLMSLFYEFHARRLPIHSLNFGVITLLPKINDAIRI
jgi:hypothetical protein